MRLPRLQGYCDAQVSRDPCIHSCDIALGMDTGRKVHSIAKVLMSSAAKLFLLKKKKVN